MQDRKPTGEAEQKIDSKPLGSKDAAFRAAVAANAGDPAEAARRFERTFLAAQSPGMVRIDALEQ